MSKRYPGGVIRKTPATPTQSSASGVWNMTDVTQAQQTNNWPVANVPNPMSRSLRFRASATAYLNRTPAVATNRKTYTWSGWVKLGKLTNTYGRSVLFGSTDNGGANNFFTLSFETNSSLSGGYAPLRMLQYTSGAKVLDRQSTSIYRDPAAWYHVVMAVDMTQSTATNRQRVYVNGVEVTAWTNTTTLAQNTDTWINYTQSHQIGIWTDDTGTALDGYMAEVNFVDGQQLAATDFGQYDQFSNWTSKKYTGTYGTNGFYLPFSNNSSTGTLGLDFSGNNNNWTTNNISVTPSYQYTTYTSSSGTYTVPAGVTSIQYLVVAGGGGGGNRSGGGGGAGGLLQGTMAVTPGQTIAYSVGTGGTGGAASGGTNNNGTNGSNSTFGSLTAIGGGGGATPANGLSGGSGGGAGHGGNGGGPGTTGQGNAGGAGAAGFGGSGGGGGAGAVGVSNSGNSGGNGGAGLTWINGTTYAGGGGGGARTDIGGSGGSGGSGGGGSAGSPGANGTANTGGGGGGGNYTGTGQAGGDGGSGVVIVAYATGNSTYDSMTDVPTQWTPYNVTGDTGGVIRGNYGTLNPLLSYTSLAPSAGNLQYTANNDNWRSSVCTISNSSGKWYAEVNCVSMGSGAGIAIGIVGTTDGPTIKDIISTDNTVIGRSGNVGYCYLFNGSSYTGGSASSYGASYTTGDIIGMALDLDAGTLTFYKNGTSQGTAFTGLSGTFGFGVSVCTPGTTTVACNFGQEAFTYAPPSGYKSLCTTNLPTPTIQQGNLVMDAATWTGVSTSSAITISSLNFQPDLVWEKPRSLAYSHSLSDSVRGANKRLSSQNTDSEITNFTYGYTSSFNSNGFTATPGASSNENWNTTGDTFAAWSWKAGNGTTSTNTAGSITSTVSVNATAGFSIVSYTGNGSAGATVGHGLGVTPSIIIAKKRSSTGSWQVYASAISNMASGYICLNATSGFDTGTSTIWNNTAPTSTVFTLGTDTDANANGATTIAYCWAEVAGFSKFGSYTGNGSTDGPFVYCGFKPAFVMTKKSSGGGDWYMWDNERIIAANGDAGLLYAQVANAESDYNAAGIDLLANGFKIRNADSSDNGSGSTMIYMAFAEYPFKSALAR